jgi:hypothetical protein
MVAIIVTWPPQAIMFLIGQFLKIFYSEAAWPNGLKHGRKSSFRGEDF